MDSGVLQAGVAVAVNLGVVIWGASTMSTKLSEVIKRVDSEAELRALMEQRISMLEKGLGQTEIHIQHFTAHANETNQSMREIRDLLLTSRITPTPKG